MKERGSSSQRDSDAARSHPEPTPYLYGGSAARQRLSMSCHGRVLAVARTERTLRGDATGRSSTHY